jgi:hypothetical protein
MRKALLLLIIFTFISAFYLNAADATGDSKKQPEIKFPGKPGLEYTSFFSFDVINNEAMTYSNSLGTGFNNPNTKLGDAPLYLRNELKASVAFPFEIAKVMTYTITPWIKDRFDIKFTTPGQDNFDNNFGYDITTGGAGITDTTKTSYVVPKNRFYVGLDNTFSFPKIINVGLNFEFRMDNDLSTANPQTICGIYTTDKAKVAVPMTTIKLSPILTLSGSYDFGLSFAITQNFNLYLLPAMSRTSNGNTGATYPSDPTYATTEFEGTYNISFDFLSFIKNKNFVGKIYVEDYLVGDIFAADYVIPNSGATSLINQNVTAYVSSELSAGFNFNIFGVQPLVAFYLKNLAFKSDDPGLGPWAWTGVKLGLGYTKDWFSFGITYIGRYNTLRQGVNTMQDMSTDPNYNPANGTATLTYPTRWENHIETFVKFKI